MANGKKIKVKLAVDARRYRIIEIDEVDAGKIREINRLIWRETDKEKRERKKLQQNNVVICSLQSIDEDDRYISIESEDVLSNIIEKERKQAVREKVRAAILHLNARQQEMVRMIYYEEKDQNEVASHFGITKSAVSHAMERIYERIKKFL